MLDSQEVYKLLKELSEHYGIIGKATVKASLRLAKPAWTVAFCDDEK